MKYTIDTENKLFKIEKDGISLELTFEEFDEMARDEDKNYFWRADVIDHVKVLVQEGELPESAIANEEYIGKVLDQYARYRIDDEWPWYDCLSEAFSRVEYSK